MRNKQSPKLCPNWSIRVLEIEICCSLINLSVWTEKIKINWIKPYLCCLIAIKSVPQVSPHSVIFTRRNSDGIDFQFHRLEESVDWGHRKTTWLWDTLKTWTTWFPDAHLNHSLARRVYHLRVFDLKPNFCCFKLKNVPEAFQKSSKSLPLIPSLSTSRTETRQASLFKR